jgi:hypothetical protein
MSENEDKVVKEGKTYFLQYKPIKINDDINITVSQQEFDLSSNSEVVASIKDFNNGIFTGILSTNVGTDNKFDSFNDVISSGFKYDPNVDDLDRDLSTILSEIHSNGSDGYKKNTGIGFLGKFNYEMNNVFNYLDNRTASKKIRDFILPSGSATKYIENNLLNAQKLYTFYYNYLIDLKAFCEYRTLYQLTVYAYNVCYKAYQDKYKEYCDHIKNNDKDDFWAKRFLKELEEIENRLNKYRGIIIKIMQIGNVITDDMRIIVSAMDIIASEPIFYEEQDMSMNNLTMLGEFATFLNGECSYIKEITNNINNVYPSLNDGVWDLSKTNPGTILFDYITQIENFSKNYKVSIEEIENDTINTLAEEEDFIIHE